MYFMVREVELGQLPGSFLVHWEIFLLTLRFSSEISCIKECQRLAFPSTALLAPYICRIDCNVPGSGFPGYCNDLLCFTKMTFSPSVVLSACPLTSTLYNMVSLRWLLFPRGYGLSVKETFLDLLGCWLTSAQETRGLLYWECQLQT